MRKHPVVATAFVILFVGSTFIGIHSARSGVTNVQVAKSLPGDQIIAQPWISIDRATVLPVAAQAAWPWVMQLGKDRGGWYAPEWLEDTIRRHSAKAILFEYQHLKVGDVVPDWGGGTLTVLAISPNDYILYGSHFANEDSSEPYNFTWALVFENSSPKSTILHLRLRLRRPASRFGHYIPAALPGLIDYLVDEIMFVGLNKKVRSPIPD